jgi:phosphoglycolate phosphatase-like HAD superfamily hydrolase
MNDSIIYALDFDGVICDSAIETALSGWKAARQIWPDMAQEAPTERIEQFRQVRPIIETGYEAILTLRLLEQGKSLNQIYREHKADFAKLMQEADVSSEDLKILFGETRDRWIAEDQPQWVAKNPLYPGIAKKLRGFGNDTWYVITTKQERFVKEIFAFHGISLTDDNLFGLDRKLSKVEVLQRLLPQHPEHTLCFVEDRLPTLVKVAEEPSLKPVKLVFALWGYNTDEDKAQARSHGFSCQTLDNFVN